MAADIKYNNIILFYRICIFIKTDFRPADEMMRIIYFKYINWRVKLGVQ